MASVTKADRATFLALSSELTGFAPIDLEGTGNVDAHLQWIENIVGADLCAALLKAARAAVAHTDAAAREQAIRTTLWNSAEFGPVIQNLVRLWYTGKWNPLPAQWQETYRWDHPDPTPASGVTTTPQAYTESLVWTAIGAHPPAAKPPGFGSWSELPAAAPGRVRLAAGRMGVQR
jgi:hypothetical protein